MKWSRSEARSFVDVRRPDVPLFIVPNVGSTWAKFAMPARTLKKRMTTRTSILSDATIFDLFANAKGDGEIKVFKRKKKIPIQ